jgi:hypothetical protein
VPISVIERIKEIYINSPKTGSKNNVLPDNLEVKQLVAHLFV